MAFLGLIGGIISAVGAMQQANAQANAAEYQGQVARNNKIIADQNAVYERQAGQVEEQTVRMKTHETISEAHAIQAASGVETEMGSPVEVRKTTAIVGELDAVNTYLNAQRRAYEYVVQGTNYEAQAGLYDYQAKEERTAGMISALGSIVGGFSSIAGSFGGGGGGGGFSAATGTGIASGGFGLASASAGASVGASAAYVGSPSIWGGSSGPVYTPSWGGSYNPGSNLVPIPRIRPSRSFY
jgi:hypothetical protein